MVVYCIMDNDWEGSFLHSIWSTKEKAEEHLQWLKDSKQFFKHSIEKWLLDEPS